MLARILVRIFKGKDFLMNSLAAMIFLMACLLTIVTQLSRTEPHYFNSPNAELEIQSLEQVEEINVHNFKAYEISPSQNN